MGRTALQIGDWGRQGHYNQSQVAALMAARADSLRPEFIISTGMGWRCALWYGTVRCGMVLFAAVQ